MSKQNLARRPRILTVGSMNMDLVMQVQRFPESNETLIGNSYKYVEGGKGGNQAVAAARLGAVSVMCGAVGDDPNGALLADRLAQRGVDSRYVMRSPGTPTGLAVIPVDAAGNNQIMIFPGANMSLSMDHVLKALNDANAQNESFDLILLQLEIPSETVQAVIAEARRRGIYTVLDAAPAGGQDLALYRGVNIVSPNESECKAWTGIYPSDEASMIEASRILKEKTNADAVVLKLGSRGSALYADNKLAIYPAFTGIKAVDSTAAGDTFTAALAVRFCETDDLDTAIRFANAAGALCVSKSGAQPSIPSREDTDLFLAERDLASYSLNEAVES